MAHLKLNGWTIPVRSGGGRDHRVVGDETTVIDGTMHKDRRGIFRKWSMTAIRQIPKDAEALIATLLANGQDWPFDADLFSGKGLNVANSGLGSLRFGIGADGFLVYKEDGLITESQFGAAALAVEPGVTNLLTKDSSDAENAATGYTAVAGGSLAASTAVKLQGTQSLEVTFAASGDGVDTATVSASASTAYVAHVYIIAEDTAAAITVSLEDDTGTIQTKNVSTIVGKWQRIELSGTSDGSATTIKIRVVKNGAGTGSFWLDAFQIVQGTVNTTWTVGASSRGVGDLEYPATFLNGGGDKARAWKAITVAFWARAPSSNPTPQGDALIITGTGGSLQIVRSAVTNNLKVTLVTDSGGSINISEAASPWDDDWHHVAVTYWINKATGNTELRLYFDGVESQSATIATRLDFSAVTKVWVGNLSGGSHWKGLIDSLMIVPFGAPVAQVLAWSNETAAMPALRKLRASGDFAPEDSVDVWGTPGEAVNAPFFDGTTQHNAALEIPFALEEG